MGKVFTDPDLLRWEAYASTGPFGFPEQSHIVFRCLSSPALRPRFVQLEGDRSEAERSVATLSGAELLTMLSESREIR